MEGKTLVENFAGAGSRTLDALGAPKALQKTKASNPGVQGLDLHPQPPPAQLPLPPLSHSGDSCENWEGRLTSGGVRYTPYPSAASHLLQAHVFKKSLILPMSSDPTEAWPPCAAGPKFPQGGRRAQLQRRRRPSAQRHPATHLSQPPPPQSPPAGEGVLGGAGAEGGAPRGRGPRASSFCARSGSGGGCSRWNQLAASSSWP